LTGLSDHLPAGRLDGAAGSVAGRQGRRDSVPCHFGSGAVSTPP